MDGCLQAVLSFLSFCSVLFERGCCIDTSSKAGMTRLGDAPPPHQPVALRKAMLMSIQPVPPSLFYGVVKPQQVGPGTEDAHIPASIIQRYIKAYTCRASYLHTYIGTYLCT